MNPLNESSVDADISGPRLSAAHPSRRWLTRPYNLLLFGIVLIAAVPRLYIGATEFIEYDGYWNAFIAQSDWKNFHWEYLTNAHPPLFYFILRAVLRFGHTPLIYRSVPIIAGLAAILVFERV